MFDTDDINTTFCIRLILSSFHFNTFDQMKGAIQPRDQLKVSNPSEI